MFATSNATTVYTLNAVNHDPLAEPMPPTLSHSGAAASLTCTGFPAGTFNPIYTYQDRCARTHLPARVRRTVVLHGRLYRTSHMESAMLATPCACNTVRFGHMGKKAV